MFSLQRKIGTGTTSRRAPARECKVGIESLDTRAVPALFFPAPGSPLLESGTGAANAIISAVSFDKFGHGFAQTQTTNPFNNTTRTTVTPLVTNLNPTTGQTTPIAGVAPGVIGTAPLAYRLPTPVADGDVLVLNFQTHNVEELIRFQTVSDNIGGTNSWMVVYSAATEAGPSAVGIPVFTTPAGQLPLLTQVVQDFGVPGGGMVEYGAEQAIYSGLLGNAAPFNFQTQVPPPAGLAATPAVPTPIGSPIGIPSNSNIGL